MKLAVPPAGRSDEVQLAGDNRMHSQAGVNTRRGGTLPFGSL